MNWAYYYKIKVKKEEVVKEVKNLLLLVKNQVRKLNLAGEIANLNLLNK